MTDAVLIVCHEERGSEPRGQQGIQTVRPSFKLQRCRHANDRRSDPQRGPGSPFPDGKRGLPDQRQSPIPLCREPGCVLDGGRRRASGRSRLSIVSKPAGGRSRKAVECIRSICVNQAEELGRLELEETKIGRLDHKIAKLQNAIAVVPGVEYLRTDNDSGDDGLTLTDYVPFGVIGAITPVTHSLPTLAGNAINMLAAGNTVVFNAHPSGTRIAAEGLRRFNKAIREAIGIDNLLTIIDPPTIESAAALFDHKAVRLLVVTGGPAVARAALASKKRAIVAGPGNPPVVVDSTACLENTARSIVTGGAFDNNLLCIGEKQVFAVAQIFDSLMEVMTRHGGVRLTASQVDALTQAAVQKGSDGGASYQQRPDRSGSGRPRRARGTESARPELSSSLRKPAPSTRSCTSSR